MLLGKYCGNKNSPTSNYCAYIDLINIKYEKMLSLSLTSIEISEKFHLPFCWTEIIWVLIKYLTWLRDLLDVVS